MAFKEIQDNEQIAGDKKTSGLNLDWMQLIGLFCPRCCDDLVLFDHLNMYKCRCGFKINTTRMNKINFSSGFYIGNYEDEPPF